MKFRYILLCIVAGAALGGAMILTHHGPGLVAPQAKSSPESRNAERTQMLHDLAAALTQYRKDHGHFPVRFPTSITQLCSTLGDDCRQVHFASLDFLINDGNYLPTIPIDPLGGKGHWGAGYYIQAHPDGSLDLTAPQAESGKSISLTFTP